MIRLRLAVSTVFIMGLSLARGLAAVTVTAGGGEIVLGTGTGAVTFSATNGSILRVTTGDGPSVCASAGPGLWQALFVDGSPVAASSFRADSSQNVFRWAADGPNGPLRFHYTNAQLAANVTIAGRDDGLEFTAEVHPRLRTLTGLSLPGRLRFTPANLNRFIGALNANESVGASFRAGFFQAQPEDAPAGWAARQVGPGGYATLFGGSLVMRADQDPPVAVTITSEGRAWLGDTLADRWNGASAVVNRPSTRAQTPLVLADSVNGPFFSGRQLGGAGWLFRLGGNVTEAQKPLAQDLVLGALEHLAASRTAGRSQLALLSLIRGPVSGGWAGVTVTEWRQRLAASIALRNAGVKLVELRTAGEMMAALAATNFLAVLNPYGEWAPVLEATSMSGTVTVVGSFVRAGGSWFEAGGHPFYYELRPTRYFAYETDYPPAFADFLHCDTTAGRASIFGVQPQLHAPWAGATNPASLFVPGHLAWGGEAEGGYCERRFATYVPPGATWSSPPVRLLLGPGAEDALSAYAQANALQRRLDQKLPPDTLTRLKRSVLVYQGGSVSEKLAQLDRIPSPALIHFADYLKGGFDKEYPDHLPPNAGFGTLAALQEFVARCQERGHLVMPYTNPTWWCDHPRGPTFQREGEAPLLRRLDGSLSYENYAGNDGYTVSHWHPAVRAANRVTLEQFTRDVPIDILFQDQCGARGWQYDLNPASPTVAAYTDGLVSMVAEDALSKPLATENGWDRIANHESMFCGMTWAIVPTRHAPDWRWFMTDRFSADTWELFPLAQYLAHGQVAMVHHDLGQFVTDDEVLAWTLGLGYGLSARVDASLLSQTAPHEWLRWLDRLQKSVCARYVGEPLTSFAHEHPPSWSSTNAGVIRAVYGPVAIEANLDPQPRAGADYDLAAHGFRATAPGLAAGHLSRLGTNAFGERGAAFVTEGRGPTHEFWIYASGERLAAIELPSPAHGTADVQLDGETPRTVRVQDGVVPVQLGFAPGVARRQPPPELANSAPRDWPAGKPAIGVLDIPGLPRSWTAITPADWRSALNASRLVSEFGAPVRSITSYTALVQALEAGPTVWLAIINPAGEVFPESARGQWRATLDLIRDYVERGGSWWETAGYSFYVAAYPNAGSWPTEVVGPAGAAFLELPVGSGAVDQAAEPLSVTARGRELLGEAPSAQLTGLASAVNRGLPRGPVDPGHLAVLAGAEDDFLGGYHLGGWGFLWRVGGFNPNRQVVVPAVVGVLEHLYSHPPLPVDAPTTRRLWHGTVTWKSGAAFKRVAIEHGRLAVVIGDVPPDATHHLERATDAVGPGGWEPVFTFSGSTMETNWTDPDGLAPPRRFYRVRSEWGL